VTMPKISHLILRPLAITAFMGVLALAAPVRAADGDAMMAQPQSAPKTAMHDHMAASGKHDIETRIKNLHDKLNITADQEQQWSPVADAMRDNEKSIHALIEERHQNAKTMSAVDDLESYEKIADQHADGLKKLIPVFKTLYDSMSDAQKKNADVVFGRYEGHPDRKAVSGK
jgi:Spy/CpxP family protein refolding chaperone